jgi:hypothetical protein
LPPLEKEIVLNTTGDQVPGVIVNDGIHNTRVVPLRDSSSGDNLTDINKPQTLPLETGNEIPVQV